MLTGHSLTSNRPDNKVSTLKKRNKMMASRTSKMMILFILGFFLFMNLVSVIEPCLSSL
jgi:hypothetical protein